MRLHNAFQTSEYRELGESGILVSPLGFGASPLGGVFGPVSVSIETAVSFYSLFILEE